MIFFSILILIILVILSFFIPIWIRKTVWKHLSEYIENEDFEEYYKELDSFSCRLCFPAYYRESIRLSAMITENRTEDIKKQVSFMLNNMSLKPIETVQCLEKGYYYFLENLDEVQCNDILNQLKSIVSTDEYNKLIIEYDVLLKKKPNHISDLQKLISEISQQKDNDKFKDEVQIVIGYYEYLLGLQYGYLNDTDNKNRHLKRALKLCKGTYYEKSIKEKM